MKKIYVILVVMCSVLLTGCRRDKDSEDSVDNSAIQQPMEDTQVNNQEEQQEDAQDDNDDEYDENGEFDPTKFQDDDIDEVMNLMKELIQE